MREFQILSSLLFCCYYFIVLPCYKSVYCEHAHTFFRGHCTDTGTGKCQKQEIWYSLRKTVQNYENTQNKWRNYAKWMSKSRQWRWALCQMNGETTPKWMANLRQWRWTLCQMNDETTPQWMANLRQTNDKTTSNKGRNYVKRMTKSRQNEWRNNE